MKVFEGKNWTAVLNILTLNEGLNVQVPQKWHNDNQAHFSVGTLRMKPNNGWMQKMYFNEDLKITDKTQCKYSAGLLWLKARGGAQSLNLFNLSDCWEKV